MRGHVWRPLYAVICLVIVVLAARYFMVPKDFGIYERGYMYGFHRKSDEDYWKAFRVKYQFNSEYCRDCHSDKYSIMRTPHAVILCENCHGPVLDHPSDPGKLTVDKKRELCLRCHFPCRILRATGQISEGLTPRNTIPALLALIVTILICRLWRR